MNKKITIYDIAREAGVSTATVTRVMAGHPNVKAKTRERVQRVIDQHAYTPSAAARHLEAGTTRTLAIVIPDITNPYFNKLFNSAYSEVLENGYAPWLMQIDGQRPIPAPMIEEIIRRQMDGALFAGNIWSNPRTGLAEALGKLRHHMPVVAICPPATALDCICIHSDLVGCVRQPVRHLHALGHRRIAFVGGSMCMQDASQRGESFLAELRELGLPDDPAYHVDSGFDAESGERAVLRMLSGLERSRWPTAIIAFNDLVAMGAMHQLKRMGLSVPQDVAVIGIDNQFFCQYADPPLTSVELYPDEIAKSAVRELVSACRSGAGAQTFNMMREATLVVRESCGAKLGYRKSLGE